MTINIISESVLVPGGHGSHIAFLNYTKLLKHEKQTVLINSPFSKADIVHTHTIGLFSLFKLITSQHAVATAHIIPESFINTWKGVELWLWLFEIYFKFFFNQVDLILAVSPQEKISLKKMGLKPRIEVFPNPTDTTRFKPDPDLKKSGREKFNIPQDDLVVLGVGQVQKRKGVDDFVAVAKLMPKLKFIWVGGIPFKTLNQDPDILKLPKDKWPPNFQIIEDQSYEQMPLIYNIADVFLFPSLQETAGMVIVEAAACGLPTVVRDLEVYKDLYQNNYLAGNSVVEFQKLIDQLFNDSQFFNEAKQKSLNLSADYGFEKLGKRLLNLYQQLLSDE